MITIKGIKENILNVKKLVIIKLIVVIIKSTTNIILEAPKI